MESVFFSISDFYPHSCGGSSVLKNEQIIALDRGSGSLFSTQLNPMMYAIDSGSGECVDLEEEWCVALKEMPTRLATHTIQSLPFADLLSDPPFNASIECTSISTIFGNVFTLIPIDRQDVWEKLSSLNQAMKSHRLIECTKETMHVIRQEDISMFLLMDREEQEVVLNEAGLQGQSSQMCYLLSYLNHLETYFLVILFFHHDVMWIVS